MTGSVPREALAEAMTATLETMFFVSCLEEPAEFAAARPRITAQLSFSGTLSGRLTLRLTDSAARSVAADFLGEDEDSVSERQTAEVVCELSNMICGAALSRISPEGEFRLDAPRLAEQADANLAFMNFVNSVETSGGSIEAALELEA